MPTLNLGRVGFVNKGTWLISTAYKINDTVTYLGGTYACLIANTGQTPILGGTIYWQEWVANNVVHTTGNESIDGIKTFTSSPIVPTPANGDSSTKTSSTAFVAAAIPYNINAATSKTTPADADELPILDSSATFGLKKLTWANLKATLKTYFDTLYAPLANVSVAGVRQTVQSGSVDTSGFANFVSIGTGLNVNIAATTTPIKVHAAGGAISADRLGTISADKTLLLPANSTSYIYESVATNGVCTSGSTTLAPIYQFGGTPAVTNGQFTYNISEGKGYLGNGTTAPQVYMTFHSEAATGASTVTSVVTYALNGMYISDEFTWAASNNYNKNHNIGVPYTFLKTKMVSRVTTAAAGYAIGDFVDLSTMSYGDASSHGYGLYSSGINNVGATFGTNPAIFGRTPVSGINLSSITSNAKILVTRSF